MIQLFLLSVLILEYLLSTYLFPKKILHALLLDPSNHRRVKNHRLRLKLHYK